MYRLPDHISEAEVLALIEGDMGSLSHERREIVRDAVARDPVLSKLVGQIRSDASAVVSLSRVAAPPEIRMRVIEDLRRPVQRPDLIREPAGGEIPVSSVIVSRENPWRQYAAGARKLAAAAALVMAAGLGLWLISNAVRQGSTHSKGGPIALVPNPATPTTDDPPFEPISIDIEPGPSLAINRIEPGNLVPDPILSDPYGFAAPVSPEWAPITDVAAATPLAKGMPVSEAIELARAGRLIIRVRAADEVAAESGIQTFASRTAKELKWRPLESWELTQVTAALRRTRSIDAPYAAAKPPATVTDKPDEKPVRPLPDVEPTGTAADVASALRGADFRPLFTVEMNENERDLAKLLEELSTDKTQVVEFIALEEPLPTLMPSTDPAAVLWWSRPPSDWTRRVCVPIVLDTRP